MQQGVVYLVEVGLEDGSVEKMTAHVALFGGEPTARVAVVDHCRRHRRNAVSTRIVAQKPKPRTRERLGAVVLNNKQTKAELEEDGFVFLTKFLNASY
ncbi:hypothetical protein [Aliagarivorans taiwanensis]|uniref:hypothetical protein n=1 Tax=Aliagarivorans taiwanensis TaxID=561966 RepID=UPI00047B778B|nr:hypothetical protein [Aliagarivorans taiwanensis]